MFGNAGFSTGPTVGDREGSPGRVRAMKLQMMNESIRSTVENVVARAPAKPKQKLPQEGPQRAGKKEKKTKKDKHGKADKEPKDTKVKKKEKKDKKRRRGKGESSASSGKSSSSGWFHKGKPCTITAISYETDPPHAVVRTHDNREVVVDMNALTHRPKKKRKASGKPVKPSQPITIDCCSSGSASDGSSDSGIEVVGEVPGPEAAEAAPADSAVPQQEEPAKMAGALAEGTAQDALASRGT